jgi:hypothetical protein
MKNRNRGDKIVSMREGYKCRAIIKVIYPHSIGETQYEVEPLTGASCGRAPFTLYESEIKS